MMRSRAFVAAASVAVVLAVTGCGDDDTESANSGTSATAPSELISANTATEEELQTIPGVGPEIAEEIVEYRPYDADTGPAKFREEMGKYLSDDDVEAVMLYLSFD